MDRKSFAQLAIASVFLLISIDTNQVTAANMRSFIEGVRRRVVVFANSFASTIPPGYLLQGTRDELLKRVESLRNALSGMSPAQLKLHEINEEDRRIQLALYDKLSAFLRTAK
jgi:hypothetical protein